MKNITYLKTAIKKELLDLVEAKDHNFTPNLDLYVEDIIKIFMKFIKKDKPS